jgi:hypothetical protein
VSPGFIESSSSCGDSLESRVRRATVGDSWPVRTVVVSWCSHS